MSTAQDLSAGAAAAEPLPAAPLLRLAPETPGPASTLDFDAFVRRYETRLLRLVLRRLNDRSDAEEITQETLLRAYQHRASFSAEDELIAWSTVVAQRLVIDRARVRGRSFSVAEVPENARMGRDTADIVVAKAEARTALDALEAIPERQAAILWAREVEGLHYEEIADRFGITEPAVRSLLHRGRRALRQEYTSRGGTLPMRGLVPFAPWLLALRSLGKVRTAARATAKAAAPAVSALALAGLTILGVGGAIDGRTPSQREVRLPAITAERTSSVTSTPRDPDLTLTATRARGGGPTAAAPGTSTDGPGVNITVPRQCGRIANHSGCIGENPDLKGDTLFGPKLPDNPTGYDQVIVSQDSVPVCSLTPTTPLTHCKQGTTRNSALNTPPDARPEGALR